MVFREESAILYGMTGDTFRSNNRYLTVFRGIVVWQCVYFIVRKGFKSKISNCRNKKPQIFIFHVRT